MVPKVKRILYATDLSPNSAVAFRYAADSARRHDAVIDILHVHRKLPGSAEAMLHAHLNDEQLHSLNEHRDTFVRNRITNRLEALRDSEAASDPDFASRIETIDVEEGNPAEVILQKADDLDCDMIITGSRAWRFLGASGVDSTSRQLLRNSHKPTFLVPLPNGETEVTFHDEGE